MSWSSLTFNQWVNRANLQDLISNYTTYGVSLKPGQTIPSTDTSRLVTVNDLTTWTDADPTNGYLASKSSSQLIAVRDVTTSPPYLIDADYIVFKYSFQVGSGVDLDTFTTLISPVIDGPVGYSAGYGTHTDQSTVAGYLHHGGDNTGNGSENIYVDIPLLKSAYPSMTDVQINCRANWYSSRGTGANAGVLGIDMYAYKGGLMVNDPPDTNYGYTNPTATSSVSHSFPPANVAVVDNTSMYTQCIGLFTYTLSTGAFTQSTTCSALSITKEPGD